MQNDTKLWNLALCAKAFYDARALQLDTTDYGVVRDHMHRIHTAQEKLDAAVRDVFKLASNYD